MGLNKREGQKTYAKLLGDGTLRVKCEESDDQAVPRTYEFDGVETTVFERKYESISGLITGIEIEDGKFGEQMKITITDEGEDTIVTMSAQSKFAESAMKKLPNVDFLQLVEIKPFSFKSDGYDQKGISFYQGDKKAESYFFDNDKKVYINEYPVKPENWDDVKKKDRLKFYDGVNQFLIDHTNAVVVPKLPEVVINPDF